MGEATIRRAVADGVKFEHLKLRYLLGLTKITVLSGKQIRRQLKIPTDLLRITWRMHLNV